jgi:hypothetical protein
MAKELDVLALLAAGFGVVRARPDTCPDRQASVQRSAKDFSFTAHLQGVK